MLVFWIFIIALIANRSEVHRYLVENGWVQGFPRLGSRVMSYIAFFFIPPCAEVALLGWVLGNLTGRPDARVPIERR